MLSLDCCYNEKKNFKHNKKNKDIIDVCQCMNLLKNILVNQRHCLTKKVIVHVKDELLILTCIPTIHKTT